MLRKLNSLFFLCLAIVCLSTIACERTSEPYAAKKDQPEGAPKYTVNESVSVVSRDTNIEEVAPKGASALPDGAALFAANCVACHQANGQGVPGVFPPLDGSPYVTDNVDRMGAIMIYGLMGPISVKGTVYNNVMAPMGSTLNDAQLAAIASYVRSAWSNKAEPVDPAVFTNLRQKWGTRGPFAITELGEEKSQLNKITVE